MEAPILTKMAGILICLLLPFAQSRTAGSIQTGIARDDSLSIVADNETDTATKHWIISVTAYGDCTRGTFHGTLYRNKHTGHVEKMTIVCTATQDSQLVYLDKGKLYKIIFNTEPYYFIDDFFYHQHANMETDTTLLKMFYQDTTTVSNLRPALQAWPS